jgi:glycosyltransferase involved in cell wall biosynthesis
MFVTKAKRARAPAPAISIVVPCRNEAGHIEKCLRDILAQEPWRDRGTFEVLVADGMSDDGTREIVRKVAQSDSRVRLIDNPGRIVSTGLNAAIRVARGGIIVRMDAHSEYAPDYVRECVGTLRHTRADNVGGPALTRAEGYVQRAVAAAYRSPFSAGGARFHDPHYEGEVDTVVYGCWRKETLLKIGLFDEELARNQDDELNYRLACGQGRPFDETMVRTEDDELNFRIVRGGGRLWQSPRIRSWYRPRSSLAALFRQYEQYGYWKVRVIQKHGRPASARHLVPVCFVFGLILGWLPGFLHWSLWAAYGAAVGFYLLLNLLFSAVAARRAGWDLFPILPVVFLTYHVGYGLGFARGLLDFVVLRRRGSPAMTALTRGAQRRV